MTLQATITKKLPVTVVVQALIGVIAGCLIILAWGYLYPTQTSMPEDLVFDSEVITLPSPSLPFEQPEEEDNVSALGTEETDTVDDIPTVSDENDPANRYPFFARFRAPLDGYQAAAVADGKPIVSIVISDVGKNRELVQSIHEKLSNNITLSLSPYATNHNATAETLSGYGFELWMDLAAITYDMNYDHGVLALNPVHDFDKNIDMIMRQLDNKDKVTGVILPTQSLIIETQDLWGSLVNDLFMQGYGILDNTTQVMKPALFFHEDKRAPYLKGDMILSRYKTADHLEQALSNLKKSVLEQGSMIATLPLTTPVTLDILADWVNSLEADGIHLVPLSAHVKL